MQLHICELFFLEKVGDDEKGYTIDEEYKSISSKTFFSLFALLMFYKINFRLFKVNVRAFAK